jgi:hypothetical protein
MADDPAELKKKAEKREKREAATGYQEMPRETATGYQDTGAADTGGQQQPRPFKLCPQVTRQAGAVLHGSKNAVQ